MAEPDFEWDEAKDRVNQQKHGVSFYEAQFAFLDAKRVIAENGKKVYEQANLL
jgi:uncharacterized DUF497 family protein